MVVLKGVRHNNLYYLIGSTVTGRVATFISSSDVCTGLVHETRTYMRKVFTSSKKKKELLEDASTSNMNLGGHGVLNKKTKVKFGTSTHRSKGPLDCVHVSIWRSIKTASLEGY